MAKVLVGRYRVSLYIFLAIFTTLSKVCFTILTIGATGTVGTTGGTGIIGGVGMMGGVGVVGGVGLNGSHHGSVIVIVVTSLPVLLYKGNSTPVIN